MHRHHLRHRRVERSFRSKNQDSVFRVSAFGGDKKILPGHAATHQMLVMVRIAAADTADRVSHASCWREHGTGTAASGVYCKDSHLTGFRHSAHASSGLREARRNGISIHDHAAGIRRLPHQKAAPFAFKDMLGHVVSRGSFFLFLLRHCALCIWRTHPCGQRQTKKAKMHFFPALSSHALPS